MKASDIGHFKKLHRYAGPIKSTLHDIDLDSLGPVIARFGEGRPFFKTDSHTFLREADNWGAYRKQQGKTGGGFDHLMFCIGVTYTTSLYKQVGRRNP
ncbi:MAG: hypothetical protein ACMZ66_21555 [Thalassospira sp.]|uniref:hypothetical protein n=1 Tax=Thalassospira sp. TaxID=1912094 RepID=UPI003A84756E